jgi:hypothetical protein
MVEIFFGIITRQAVRRGSFTSVKDLIDTIRCFIDSYNDRCQPFTWTKDADTILAKAQRSPKTKEGDLYATLANRYSLWHRARRDVHPESGNQQHRTTRRWRYLQRPPAHVDNHRRLRQPADHHRHHGRSRGCYLVENAHCAGHALAGVDGFDVFEA